MISELPKLEGQVPGALPFASCPPSEENCSCGTVTFELRGGVVTMVDNECTNGCDPPPGRIFTSEQIARMGWVDGCRFKRCCV